MRLLLTAGPTREPIDPVRFISNHSSGRLGLAVVQSALAAGHQVTAILGPVSFPLPPAARRVDVETTRQMYDAVLRELPNHDVLIMAAAVCDYRPKQVADSKLGRHGTLTLELEATEDIVASAVKAKSPTQRIIGFALETEGNLDRAREKLKRKNLDLIVYNPLQTMNSQTIAATLISRDGHTEPLQPMPKEAFATILVRRAAELIF